VLYGGFLAAADVCVCPWRQFLVCSNLKSRFTLLLFKWRQFLVCSNLKSRITLLLFKWRQFLVCSGGYVQPSGMCCVVDVLLLPDVVRFT
jgi:hypothetical protein